LLVLISHNPPPSPYFPAGDCLTWTALSLLCAILKIHYTPHYTQDI
jgi:hypothetical protein